MFEIHRSPSPSCAPTRPRVAHRLATLICLAPSWLVVTACDPADPAADGWDAGGDEVVAAEPDHDRPAPEDDGEAEGIPECVKDRSCVVKDVPAAELELTNGDRVNFFTYEDGSVGVLEAGPSALPVAARPEFADLTPLELFWALTVDDTPIPDGLLAQQEFLADEQDGLSVAAVGAQPRGWMLAEIDALAIEPDAQEYVNCSNSWGSTYCGQGGEYNSGWCSYDTGGSWTYAKSGTNKFRSFHCQQTGIQWGSLDYRTQNTSCGYTSSWHEVWYTMFCEREDWNGSFCHDTWRAATWTWWPGSSTSRRRWVATTNYDAGAAGASSNYDWGNKARYMGCG